MFQGTGSNVGKSVIVAALCRAFANRGLNVAPFKPQNMSNNAAVTSDGGEIGRAQALQARAARVPLSVHMNPILLKPESETGSQVVVQGHSIGQYKARAYGSLKSTLLPKVLESFHRLADAHDLILIEGAGSPAEVNLRAGDIANMGFACAADVPVVLIGDIDRGGVIAQVVGTHHVLSAQDRGMICAFGINKFRGDPTLFDDGLTVIQEHTSWPSLGVLTWLDQAWKLPAEDAQDLAHGAPPGDAALNIYVPKLSRIANFDDLDPLAAEPNVNLTIIQAGQAIPADADLIIVPGTKSTIADLKYLRAQGWDVDIQAHVRRGGKVLGICGGYQMLGTHIDDPHGSDGTADEIAGLSLLNVRTRMAKDKTVTPTEARHADTGHKVTGYEIHMGVTDGPDCARAWLSIEANRQVSAMSADGRILGSYIHGMFSEDRFRADFLAQLGVRSEISFDAEVDAALDAVAAQVASEWDLDHILAMARDVKRSTSEV